MASVVDDVGVAIDYRRLLVGHERRMSHPLQRVLVLEGVAGVEEYEVVALCHLDTFVHRVVESAVGFRDGPYPVGRRSPRFFFILPYQFHGVILRLAVDDEMLHLVIVLALHARQRPRQFVRGVVGTCDNGYGHASR